MKRSAVYRSYLAGIGMKFKLGEEELGGERGIERT